MKEKSRFLSSGLSLKFANRGKIKEIQDFIKEYNRVVVFFVEKFEYLIKNGEKVPAMPNKKLATIEDSWLYASAVQCAAKQASGIVNGIFSKNKKRKWKALELKKAGKHEEAKKLNQIIEKNKIGKIVIKNIEPQLNSRFFSLQKNKSSKLFDYLLCLKSIGSRKNKRGRKIYIPLKAHRHFNGLLEGGVIANCIRLSENMASFSVKINKINNINAKKIIGIDIGKNSIFSTSDSQQITSDKHGWNLNKIIAKIVKKQRGSNNFKSAIEHRKNFINWAAKQIDLQNVSLLRIEKIKNVKKYKTSKEIFHWNSREISKALKTRALKLGVQVDEVNPVFTSQRCSNCGWVRESSRNRGVFICDSCGNTGNADINAARNIALGLPKVSEVVNGKKINQQGFYWPVSNELTVRCAKKLEKG